jgi:predicted DNA-binding transcriptional regulator AlpA
MDRTNVSRTTIWRLEQGGKFPRRRRISINRVGWVEAEVDDWIASREAVVKSEDQSVDR